MSAINFTAPPPNSAPNRAAKPPQPPTSSKTTKSTTTSSLSVRDGESPKSCRHKDESRKRIDRVKQIRQRYCDRKKRAKQHTDDANDENDTPSDWKDTADDDD